MPIQQDIRFALRTLRRSPGFALVVVAVLALGIGANTAIFSVMNAVMLRPLPYPEPDRLVEIYERAHGDGWMTVSYPNFLDWHGESEVFESVDISGSFGETLAEGSERTSVRVTLVSHEHLRTLGIRPALGRDFTAEDDRPGSPCVVLLRDTMWKSRFGSDPNVLGRILTLDRTACTVIGVLPPYPHPRDRDLLMPIAPRADARFISMRDNHNGTVVTARLKPGVTLKQAQSRLDSTYAELRRRYTENKGTDAVVQPMRESVAGDMRGTLYMLLGAVSLVLLIACANIANLLLARARSREREMAIRTALGASRTDIVRQLVVEALLLTGIGTLCGLAAARLSFGLLERFFPGVAPVGGLSLDGRVLLFAVGVSLLSALIFGVVPALQVTRIELAEAMKSARGSGDRGPGRQRLRRALVVSEVALAVVLLVGSGLLLRSLLHVLDTEPGFRAENVVVARVRMPSVKNFNPARAPQFFERLVERIEALPGVVRAGAVNALPLGPEVSQAEFHIEGKTNPARSPSALQHVATPGYFGAMGIPVKRGRIFTAADGRSPSVDVPPAQLLDAFKAMRFTVVINESFARQYWPNEDPIGRTFRFGPPEMHGPPATIVGVVGDTRQLGLDSETSPQYYFSGYQFLWDEMSVVVRTHGDAAALTSSIRRIVSEVDAQASVSNIRAMQDVVDASTSSRRTNAALVGTFSAVALLLAALGVYGVVAFLVVQRTHEFGVRVAVGAAPRDVVGLVLKDAVVLGSIGTAAGLAISLATTRLISGMLYGVTAMDPLTFATVAAVLLGVAALASYLPARRAVAVDPLTALRAE